MFVAAPFAVSSGQQWSLVVEIPESAILPAENGLRTTIVLGAIDVPQRRRGGAGHRSIAETIAMISTVSEGTGSDAASARAAADGPVEISGELSRLVGQFRV